MSKYIRTENGVYDTSKGIYIPSIKMYAIGTETIYEKDIINQANTIEELVDEFVYHYKDNKPILVNEEQIKQLILLGLIQNVYGAIWNDKGLIYVAKLNEKGELELI